MANTLPMVLMMKTIKPRPGEEGEMKQKLLLHTCCASCAVYVYQQLAEVHGYDVTCFFYNPNIHPVHEYEARKKELERIATLKGWPLIVPGNNIKEWYDAVKGHEKDLERGERCSLCFTLRLKKTLAYAALHGFTVVASTLSISPYKVTAQINAVGEKLAREYEIEFLPENFKKQNGYNRGKQMAMELGVVHQQYCGCMFSRRERQRKLEGKTGWG